jgi:sugar/nucleoside kinase (ribokinase family)
MINSKKFECCCFCLPTCERMMQPTYCIVGESYVDLFCFLKGGIPGPGEDSTLVQPVQNLAGGSTVNTATHLQNILDVSFVESQPTKESDATKPSKVVVQTVWNEDDEYGKLLSEHAHRHGFQMTNCWRKSDSLESSSSYLSTSTPHCVVIVSHGERSFMTHRGCAQQFVASDLDWEAMANVRGPLHLHVAGYYCTPGFGNGNLKECILQLCQARKHKYPHESTTISLVTQFDVTQKWDGGLDAIIPLLTFSIMNEVEAHHIAQRISSSSRKRTGCYDDNKFDEQTESNNMIDKWMLNFSALSASTCFVVTRGAGGAIAFRNAEIVAKTSPLANSIPLLDPTGAGDAFAAGFIRGLWDWREKMMNSNPLVPDNDWTDDAIRYALAWGCAVGTSSVLIAGASIPSNLQKISELYNEYVRNTS